LAQGSCQWRMGACNNSQVTLECKRIQAPSACAVQVISCGQDEVVEGQVLSNCQLIHACREGDLENIVLALVNGADLEARTLNYTISVPNGSWGSDWEYDAQPGPECTWSFGLTPLMVACREGRSEAVRLLLAKRACPHLQDEDGMRPLHFAAEAGCFKCCQALLVAGADPLIQDDNGRDAYACLSLEATEDPREREMWLALLRPSSHRISTVFAHATCTPPGFAGLDGL